MKYHKLVMVGILIMSMASQTQAAVYGSLKQDVQVSTETGEKLVKLAGQGVSILAVDEDNYLINMQGDNNQYVNKNLVEIAGVITTTLSDETKLREGPTGEATLLTYLKANTLVMVLEKENEFYKIKVNDTVGYIYKGQLNTEGLEAVPVKSSLGEDIISYAKNYLGGRYVYGGNNLETGVDCSGFTSQIMKRFGINLERSSRSQYSSNGYLVSVNELQAGDLVFYGDNGYINHVAIYAGNGEIIHASDERTGIRMSNLYYGKSIVGCKRVIG